MSWRGAVVVAACSLALAAVLAGEALAGCQGTCKPGELSVCVQAGGDCHCACVKDASSGAQALRDLLQGVGASATATEDGVKRYKRYARAKAEKFSFELKDGETTFIVSGAQS